MLYNVLPPLVFFASLGGITLVISRVVIRLRHDQAVADIQISVTAVTKRRSYKVQELAGILSPSHKSVHAFTNRLAVVGHYFQTLTDNLKAAFHDRNKLKAIKKAKFAQPIPDPIKPSTTLPLETKDIIQPPSAPLRERLSGIANLSKRVFSQGANKLKNTGLATQERIKNIKIAKKELPPEPAKDQTLKTAKSSPVLRIVKSDKVIASNKSVTVPTTAKKTASPSGKQNGLSKLFAKETKKTPLQQAKDAMRNEDLSEVESILIPYIIKHPKDTSAYMLLGKAAISRSEWDEAIEVYEQVIKIDPQTKGCYAALGRATYKAGKITKAIESLQQAHNNNPQDVAVIKQLLTIARRMDNQPMQHSLTEELRELSRQKENSK